MSTHIVISNEKGGVGKTSTAVSLAHGLALSGHRVLLIDLDPQGSTTRHLGHQPAPAIRRLLLGNESVKQVAIKSRDNLDLISANVELADVRDFLAMKSARDRDGAMRTLLNRLKAEKKQYDYIVTDCSPAVDILTINALMAGDSLIVPVSVDFLSAVGTQQHLETLGLVEELGGEIALDFIVPTRYDGRTKRAQRILGILRDKFGELVSDPIRSNTSIGEAAHYGKSIFEHAPKSNGAIDYGKLVKAVLKNE